MEKLYIIIPAYNEEENIREVVREWYPVVERYRADGASRLVIIDDGSKDGTFSILQEMKKEYPLLEAVTKQNAGHGATVLYGYRYALQQGADYIFQTDSDRQTVPGEFAAFWELRNQYDMVIGHRTRRQDGISRIFVTKVLKFVIALTFKVVIPDANTPFRLMRAEALSQLVELVPKDFNLSNVFLAVAFEKRGYRVRYLPITFRPRQGGVNSINLKKIFGIGKKAVRDFYALSKNI